MSLPYPPLPPSPVKDSRPLPPTDDEETAAFTQRLLATDVTVGGETYTLFDLVELAKSPKAADLRKFVIIQEKNLEYQRDLELRCDAVESSLQDIRESAPANPSYKRSIKIPDPAPFEGKIGETEAWEDFKIQLFNKLEGNAELFTSNTHKVTYLISRLETGPRTIVTNYRRSNDEATFAQILSILDEAYGDQFMESNAGLKLQNCKQLNKPFNAWMNEFRVLASRSGLEDRTICQYLKQNLSSELKLLLPTVKGHKYMGFQELVTSLNEYADTMQSFAVSTKSNKPTGSGRPNNSSPAATGSTSRTSSSPSSGARGPLPAEEKARRREKGLCLYYGNSGHQVLDCPNRKPLKFTSRSANITEESPTATNTKDNDKSEKA